MQKLLPSKESAVPTRNGILESGSNAFFSFSCIGELDVENEDTKENLRRRGYDTYNVNKNTNKKCSVGFEVEVV